MRCFLVLLLCGCVALGLSGVDGLQCWQCGILDLLRCRDGGVRKIKCAPDMTSCALRVKYLEVPGVLLPTILETTRSCSDMPYTHCQGEDVLLKDCIALCETDDCNHWKVPPTANNSLWL